MGGRRLLSDVVSSDNIKHVPSNYIRPLTERPNLEGEEDDDGSGIPVIDLRQLHGPNRTTLVHQIGLACHRYGFFQVKNHGISELIIRKMMQTTRDFFKLPEEERLKAYSDDPTKATRLSTSFNIRTEKIANWRDFLRLHCHPLEDYIHEWPANPVSFKEDVGEYCKSLRGLAVDLIGAISESLGLDRDYIKRRLGEKEGQHMALNYYPPCPEPHLTYGLPPHTDGNLITLLLQDDVAGLQVLHNGHWIPLHPVPNTFIVNIGDQIQVLSNDKYKSVLHRAVVNQDKERISIPTFYSPSSNAVIGPAPELVNESQPAIYRQFTYGEYYEKFWNNGLATENCLDMFLAS